MGNHHPWPDLPDNAREITAKHWGHLQVAVFLAQEEDAIDAEHVCRGPLFALAYSGKLTRIYFAILGAAATIRAHDVVDVLLVLPEHGDRATCPELRVVRMGADDEQRSDELLGHGR
jgi:hypothetical protein